MKQIKKTKFALEKFELARLKNPKNIIGGTGANGDPVDGTDGSKLCSRIPTCKDNPDDDDDDIPVRPTDIC